MLRWLSGLYGRFLMGDTSISRNQPQLPVLTPKSPVQPKPSQTVQEVDPQAAVKQVPQTPPPSLPQHTVQISTTRPPLIDEQAMTGVLDTLRTGKPLDQDQRQVVASAAHALDKFLLKQADSDPNVARKLAMNPHTPPGVLAELADRHSDKMITVSLLVSNPSTPRSALNKLYDRILGNPDISPETRSRVLQSIEQHPQAKREFSLVQRNILTAMAGEKDLDKVVAKLREKDPGSHGNLSDDDLKKMIVASPEYKKTPSPIRISSSRLKQLDGNVKLKFMLEAAPELYSPALMKPTIDRLTTEKTGLASEIAVLKEKLKAGQAELKTLTDPQKIQEKREELIDLKMGLNNKESRLAEVDRKLVEINKGLERAKVLSVGKGHMAYDSVKKEFLKDGTDRRQFAMEAVIDFRREFVLATYREVVADLKKAAIDQLTGELATLEGKQPRDNVAIENKKKELKETTEAWDTIDIRAVGSTDLTSDFDMTVLANKAGMDTQVMKEVNRRMGEKFGKEAGSVFDTNLYVAGSGPAIKQEVATGPKKWADKEATASHDEGQDIASLVKQRKYSTPEQWQKFVNAMKEGLEKKLKAANPPMQTEEIAKLVKTQTDRYAEADKWFQQSDKAIKDKMAELRQLPEHRDKSIYDLEITAMNRLFEHYSGLADQTKQEWESIPDTDPVAKDKKWAEYTRKDCFAQLFANEPYYSEGPVRHVVGNEQALTGLKLNPETGRLAIIPDVKNGKPQALVVETIQALESLNENLGDSRKEFEHLKGKPMGEIAIKASKYMGRLTRAIQLALPQQHMSQEMQKTIHNLQGAEVELLRIRKGGELPKDFHGTKDEYAMKVLKDNGLGDLDSLEKLEECFEKLKLDAEIEIRSRLITSG